MICFTQVKVQWERYKYFALACLLWFVGFCGRLHNDCNVLVKYKIHLPPLHKAFSYIRPRSKLKRFCLRRHALSSLFSFRRWINAQRYHKTFFPFQCEEILLIQCRRKVNSCSYTLSSLWKTFFVESTICRNLTNDNKVTK